MAGKSFQGGEAVCGVTGGLGSRTEGPVAGQGGEGVVAVEDEWLDAAKQNGRNRVEQSRQESVLRPAGGGHNAGVGG